MVNSRNISALMIALTAVGGCNISERPIPPLEVGGGSVLAANSSDEGYGGSTGQFSNTSAPVQSAYPQDDPVSRVRLPRAPVGNAGSYSDSVSVNSTGRGVEYAGTEDVSYDQRRQGRAQTLEAQAADLTPVSAPRQNAIVRREAEPEEQAPEIAAVSAPARIALAEVSGVGVDAASPLATRFGTRAKQEGLAFTTADDTSATHVRKGYFNVTSEGSGSVVNYVWEISDRAGNRLHRIQGSEPGGQAGSGWDGVSASAMEAVADKSIDETVRYLHSHSG